MEKVFTPEEALKSEYPKLSAALDALLPQIDRGQTAAIITPNGEKIHIPEDFVEILLNAVQAMQLGQSISIVPRAALMTTQQAADFLNISRPTFIKNAPDHKINFQMVGNHRRVSIEDVLRMKVELKDARSKALEELTKFQSDLGLYEDALE